MNVLALDCGSSSVIAGVLNGGPVTGDEPRTFFKTKVNGPRVEVDANEITNALRASISKLGDKAKKVDLIALAVMSPAWVAMDARGKALTPIITHQDRRSVEEARALEKRVGKQRHLRLAGNRPYPGGISSTTWAWYQKNHPEILRKADLVGHLNTFLHRRMTGTRVIDPSNASFTGLYRTAELGGWSEELCDAVGAKQSQLPEIHDGDQVGGAITPAAAREFGLMQGTPMLVSVVDGSAGMLMAGANVGQMFNVTGSTDVLALCTNKPKPREGVLTRALGVGRSWLTVCTLAAVASALYWARLQFYSEMPIDDFRKLMVRLARRYVGYTGYFRLYNTPFHLLSKLDYTEKQDLYAPNGINGGQSTLFDDLRKQKVPFYLSDGRLDEAANFAAAKRNITHARPKFVYVFLSQLGNILQAEGTSSENVTAKIDWYEQQVRELLKTAEEHYGNVTLSVFSDHGMTDIRKECALMQIVNSLPLEFGKDYFAVYDSTMARFWFLNDHAERAIVKALECNQDGRWLTEETLEEWGCNFPDYRYGDRFFLLKPGVLLYPSFMGKHPPAATNGFDPGHEDSVAFFATNQPKLPKPKGLEDLRRVLSQSIGLAA